MTWMTIFDLLTLVDFAALVLFFAGWNAMGWFIEKPPGKRPSVSMLMAGHRREWMHQMITREPRIFDAQMIGHLRQGAAFFASATMLAIGGGLALVGNTDPLRNVARDLTNEETSPLIWEIKLILIVVLIAHAFLKYVWSHRLFGYSAVLMSAVPNDPQDPMCKIRADQAADVLILGAKAFTGGMRATYFALAACAWLLGPIALIVATAATLGMLWRREFLSNTHATLMRQHAHAAVTAHSPKPE